MKVIHQVHPSDFARYNTSQIRERFLLENLVSPDKIECAYSHYDRMIVGAAHPVNGGRKDFSAYTARLSGRCVQGWRRCTQS